MSLRPILKALVLLLPSVALAAPPRVLVWDGEIAGRKMALVRGEDQFELEDLHPSKRSTPVDLRGEGKTFLRALDRESGDGEPVQREFTIGDDISHPLLLVMPDEDHPTGLRVVVFNDDPAGFKWGSYRFLNATSKALALRLENQSIRLPSGWKATDVHLTGDARGVGAMIAALDSLRKPLYSAVWEYDPSIRTICFIVPGNDPRLGPIEIKAVPEDRTSFELDQRESRTWGARAVTP